MWISNYPGSFPRTVRLPRDAAGQDWTAPDSKFSEITALPEFPDAAQQSYLGMVPGGGIEPPTRGFSIHCSTPELPGHGWGYARVIDLAKGTFKGQARSSCLNLLRRKKRASPSAMLARAEPGAPARIRRAAAD